MKAQTPKNASEFTFAEILTMPEKELNKVDFSGTEQKSYVDSMLKEIHSLLGATYFKHRIEDPARNKYGHWEGHTARPLAEMEKVNLHKFMIYWGNQVFLSPENTKHFKRELEKWAYR